MPAKKTPRRASPRKPPRKRSPARTPAAPSTGRRRRSATSPTSDSPQLSEPQWERQVLQAGESTPETSPTRGTIPFEIDTARLEEALEKIRSEVVRWANKGRHTKVRFKFRGRQLLPDIPLAAVMAAEGLSFYWAGLLRALAVNVAGGALIDVELVNDSEKVIAQGREALLAGDVERALEHFNRATEMDPDNAQAWLNLGVASKLRGDVAGARAALEKARTLGRNGPAAAEAERILQTLGNQASSPQSGTPDARPNGQK